MIKTTIFKRLFAFAILVSLVFPYGIQVLAEGENTGSSGNDNDTEWNEDWNTSNGRCGAGMNWTLDMSTGTLLIKGSGSMWSRYDYPTSFWSQEEVKSVSFDGSVSSIGAGAFSGCTQLTAIALPQTVRTIGAKAFINCTGLKEASFANTVATIGSNSFAGCTGLKKVIYSGSRQDWLFLTEGIQTGIPSGTEIQYSSPIRITAQPVSVSVNSGTVVRFTVKAESDKALAYQWYYRKKGVKTWSLWRGHTTASTTASANDTWNGMQVYCRISDGSRYVSSDISVITLVNVLKITEQPADAALNVGDTAKFTVKAQGSGLTYQWYYKKYGVSGWSLWKGHTTATTSACANETWDGMQIYCVVKDSGGNSLSSNAATIRINNMPCITSQPADVTARVNDVVRFTVKAKGSGLKYQWYYKKYGVKSWSKWNGHTAATTSACVNSTWDGIQLYCVITDSFGRSVSSKPATVKLLK